MDIYTQLLTQCFPNKNSSFNSFANNYRLNSNFNKIDGWKIYDPEAEYKRQGLNFSDEKSKFRLTKINNDWKICDTYPKLLVVPTFFTEDNINEGSKFRTKNRFPGILLLLLLLPLLSTQIISIYDSLPFI